MSSILYARSRTGRSSSNLARGRLGKRRFCPALLGCLLTLVLGASGLNGPTSANAQSASPERALLVRLDSTFPVSDPFLTDETVRTDPESPSPEQALLGKSRGGRPEPARQRGAAWTVANDIYPDGQHALLGRSLSRRTRGDAVTERVRPDAATTGAPEPMSDHAR